MQPSWTTVGPAGFSLLDARYISLALHPTTGAPYVAYQDSDYGQFFAVMTFEGNHWSSVGQPMGSGEVDYVSLALHPTTGLPYVAFQYDRNTATVVTFDGFNWLQVGSYFYTYFPAYDVSLALHPITGAPYIAYSTDPYMGHSAVMTFNGSDWSYVSTEGFFDAFSNWGDYLSLALHPTTGTPFVAFKDIRNSGKVTVVTFDNGAWSSVGTVGDYSGDSTTLALHPTTGAPYVAFVDSANSYKATVITFNGSDWSTVGTAGFSAGGADWISLALHPTTGAPYVAFHAELQNITVMAFHNGAWSTVGSAGFSAIASGRISLALHPVTGEPFVAFTDAANSNKATVMTFA